MLHVVQPAGSQASLIWEFTLPCATKASYQGCLHAGAVPQPQMDADLSASQSSAEAEGSGGLFGGWFGGSKKQEEPAPGSFEADGGFTAAPQFR